MVLVGITRIVNTPNGTDKRVSEPAMAANTILVGLPCQDTSRIQPVEFQCKQEGSDMLTIGKKEDKSTMAANLLICPAKIRIISTLLEHIQITVKELGKTNMLGKN